MLKLTIQNNMKGVELKKLINEKLENKEKKLRMFCIGQEIEDKSTISKYNINEDYAIICSLVVRRKS